MAQTVCRHCGKEFSYNPNRQPGHFCSQACNYASRSKAISATCQYCGSPFSYIASDRPGRFCSRACHYAARRETPEERFWKFVHKGEGCWEWTGNLARGYGRLRLNDKKRTRIQVHRFSWELHQGPIPDGALVCHRCDNRRCVRPDHLFLGTYSDNALDSVAKGRNYKGPRASFKGEAHPMAKLTEQQVRAIRQEYANGIKRREIATRYGISPNHVNFIARRDSWKHI